MTSGEMSNCCSLQGCSQPGGRQVTEEKYMEIPNSTTQMISQIQITAVGKAGVGVGVGMQQAFCGTLFSFTTDFLNLEKGNNMQYLFVKGDCN